MADTDPEQVSTTLREANLDQLRDQLETAAEVPFYESRFAEAGVDVGDIGSISDFQELPFISNGDLVEDFSSSPPYGSFPTDDAQHLFFTPAGDQLMPQFNTSADWERMAEIHAEHYRDLGIGPGDVVLNCVGYSLFIAGLLQHQAILATGATPIPVGPGDSERAAAIAERYEADAMVAFTSFAQKVSERADASLSVLIGVGEPLSISSERREAVRESFEPETTIADLYGIAQFGLGAVECTNETGMHVMDDFAIVEIIDPDTGELVEYGDRGEIVLTHLHKDAMPMVRYRTGDLTSLEKIDCSCGRTYTLSGGVIGRVDNRLKVKGVKVYPDTTPHILDAYPDLGDDYVIKVSREDRTDYVTLILESETPDAVGVEEIKERFAKEWMIRPNEVQVQPSIETEETVIDTRYD